MANRYYGISKDETAVTVDSSTTSKSVEVVVNDAVGLKKKDVVLALHKAIDAVLEDTGGTYTV